MPFTENGSSVDDDIFGPPDVRSQVIKAAITHFNELNSWLNESAPLSLEMGLCSILSLTSHRVVTAPGWRPLSFEDHQRLIAAVYRALAGAVTDVNTSFGCDRLREGMKAAASIVDHLRSGDIDNDRYRDAKSRTKILVHWCRIVQHRDDIHNRRQQRQRVTVAKLMPKARDDVFS